MTPRSLVPVTLLLVHCASVFGGPVLQREIAKGAVIARTSTGTAPLDVELFRTTARADDGAERSVDIVLLRDPENGLTFRRIVSIGDRPFIGVRAVVQSQNDMRFVEHQGRIFGFALAWGVWIEDFSQRTPSLRAAEKAATRWLAEHREAANPNRIDIRRFVAFAERVPGFFSDSPSSQPKLPILRDVVREADHWLVTIESPSHRLATLVINDNDQLVDVRLETK
jgi:hypothetical protein